MDERKNFEQTLEAELTLWGNQIKELSQAARVGRANGKAKFFERLQSLRSKETAAWEMLAHLRRIENDKWREIRPGMREAWRQLRVALEEMETV